MRNVLEKRSRENKNTYFIFSKGFFCLKSRLLREIVEKYGRAGRAIDGRIAYAHWMLDA
jgi:hypothetical protein